MIREVSHVCTDTASCNYFYITIIQVPFHSFFSSERNKDKQLFWFLHRLK